MVEKTTILQIIGCLMKHPQYLSETDRYNLTIDDVRMMLIDELKPKQDDSYEDEMNEEEIYEEDR